MKLMIDTRTLIGIVIVVAVVIAGVLILVYDKGCRDGYRSGYSDGEGDGCRIGFAKAADSTLRELEKARREAKEEAHEI